MRLQLYVVPGSHPSAAVEKALQLKGLAYERVDLLPLLHKVSQQLQFGKPTVPAMRIDGGKVVHSKVIMRTIDALAPTPQLLPTDPEARKAVEQAEDWSDEIVQPLVRRLIWYALSRDPDSMPSYATQSRLPLPINLAMLVARPILWGEMKIQKVTPDQTQADLKELPELLKQMDKLIQDDVIGGSQPNAVDLQLGASVALLKTVGDLRPLVEKHDVNKLAELYFSDFPGKTKDGVYPLKWLQPLQGPE